MAAYALLLGGAYWAGSRADDVALCNLTKETNLGVVKDRRYFMCTWPNFDKPTKLFEEGSSGIRIKGGNTPRNVILPDDTVFEDYLPDAIYPAELAFQALVPGWRSGQDVTPEQSAQYVKLFEQIYEPSVLKENPRATVINTNKPVYYFKDRDEKREPTAVIEISPKDAADFVAKRRTEKALRTGKVDLMKEPMQ